MTYWNDEITDSIVYLIPKIKQKRKIRREVI